MIITISLTQGYVATIDIVDSDLADHKWSFDSGYAQRGIWNGTKVIKQKLHRVVLSRKLGVDLTSNNIVDHINLDKLDNRRSNLRLISQKNNARHTRLYNTNTSGYRGVSWDKEHNNWLAYIHVDNKQIKLGRYTDIIEAAKAYNKAAGKYFGAYAVFNIV